MASLSNFNAVLIQDFWKQFNCEDNKYKDLTVLFMWFQFRFQQQPTMQWILNI